MGTNIKEELLNEAVKKIGEKKGVFSAVLCVESGDHHFSWTGAVGDMQKDSQYFIASVTNCKLSRVITSIFCEL